MFLGSRQHVCFALLFFICSSMFSHDCYFVLFLSRSIVRKTGICKEHSHRSHSVTSHLSIAPGNPTARRGGVMHVQNYPLPSPADSGTRKGGAMLHKKNDNVISFSHKVSGPPSSVLHNLVVSVAVARAWWRPPVRVPPCTSIHLDATCAFSTDTSCGLVDIPIVRRAHAPTHHTHTHTCLDQRAHVG